jgi:hypothetical protein
VREEIFFTGADPKAPEDASFFLIHQNGGTHRGRGTAGDSLNPIPQTYTQVIWGVYSSFRPELTNEQ